MNRILMVSPEHFDILYAINPHMKDRQGNLNAVDKPKAKKQWETLKTTYEKLGVQVDVLASQPGLPDMVFAANQSFFFREKILLSRMRSEFRRAEVEYFNQWYLKNGFEVLELEKSDLCFEGTGDALFEKASGKVFGAYGLRTDKGVYRELNRRFALKVIELELVTEEFYHLDTCLAILSPTTAAIYPKAFSKESLQALNENFPHLIPVSFEENKSYFACNCHSPNGKDVILQKGSVQFVKDLQKYGFIVHEVDTSEFIKAGGSVFCLKMEL